jgi:phosphoserine phosphatase RsbU/P
VLAASFNGMTTKIRELIGEVKKKEKLDAELKIARQVQLNLFPTSVPALRTLELAATCLPGRIVSGDYYDYVRRSRSATYRARASRRRFSWRAFSHRCTRS